MTGNPDDGSRQRTDDGQAPDMHDAMDPWLDAVNVAAELAAEEQDRSGPPTREPVRHDDPVALMLGLVPDPGVLVDGRKLAAARKRSRLDLRQLVTRLNARGWEVTMQEAFKWELGRPALAPALITAIAEELSVGDDALLTAVQPTGGMDDLFDDQRIQAFLSDWAAEAGVQPAVLRQRASSTLADAAHRNRTGGSVEALLGVLRQFRSIPGFLDRS
ncbi:hypothetical protein [Kutzneria kofuensis]|uniref:Transcriptional regulator with XRE-family HTH domain n=1 Tax=Kutzneria kofuensis TaxID=103725 RepID=A0A7W9NGM1_9PSEU|nr:hypothetical protein [Kutzneria kofuensis]MBB5891860.1 transcriptional regulator with XRE-family HTH domain [Kutzneria kofuensis]